MKRRLLIQHLEAHGCTLKREGAEHTIYQNATGEIQAVPRHAEIGFILARKICRCLSVPAPAGK